MRAGSRASLFLALIFGAAAAFLVRNMLQNGSDPNAATRTIVVARQAVSVGLPLTADNLREVPWRSADPLEGSFATIPELVRDGRRLTLTSLQRNEPILVGKVTAPNQRATLSTQLDEGMRAVRVDEVRGVAGFVLPSDRVDIILTRGEGTGQDAGAFADLLLQNARVLAVDQLASEGQDKPTIARAVTLELTVQQAQKVVLAQGIGRLSLVLRQANEPDDRLVARVTANDLGPGNVAERDRLAEIEKRLEDIRKSSDEARLEAERNVAKRLSEAEARMRSEMTRTPAALPAAVQPMVSPPRSVVNVIRNGSKTEQYSVAAER